MRLASVNELSEILKVKKATLYAWAHKGTIPYFKLNGLIRFDMDEIEEWVKSSKSKNAEAPKLPSGGQWKI